MSSALVHKQSEALLTLGSKPLPRLPNPNPWSSPDFPHLLQSLSAPPHLGLALISPKAWSSECSGLWGCSDPPWHSFGARAVPLRLFRTCFSPGLGEKPPQTARGAGGAGTPWHRLLLQAASQNLPPSWNKLTEDNLELPLAGDAGRETIPSSKPFLHLSPIDFPHPILPRGLCLTKNGSGGISRLGGSSFS